jgi:Na+-driven multidrug efflux pump
LKTVPAVAPLTSRRILSFWLPLAATWLMMAVEGPYVAAIIARLANPTINLAAYGVAFSFAFISEAPIIMIMTAANALVRDRASFVALRRFIYTLNALVTAAFLVGLSPPLFRFFTDQVVGLPPEVAELTHLALGMLVLWPGAIGYRRFYQGILVRHGMPRLVAYGTVVRLASMSVSAVALAALTRWPGAAIGAIALVSGVVMEAAASRWMARHLIARLLTEPGTAGAEVLSTRAILRFYVPLALTSLIAIGAGCPSSRWRSCR